MSSISIAPMPPLRRTVVDRAFALVTDVRPGEAATALLLAVNLFLLLSSYYVLKPVREALILTQGGAEVKSYASALQALLLLGIVPLYGAVASRVRRNTLIAGVTLFFASHLLVFAATSAWGFRVGVLFFVWLGIFNVLAIAQTWSFANDIYRSGQGQRLFPLIGIGSAAGAWAGAELSRRLFAVASVEALMVGAAAGFAACAAVTWTADRLTTRAAVKPEPVPKGAGGFGLVFHSRYLLGLALLIVVLNVVNSTGEYMFGKLVVANAAHVDAAVRKAFIGQTYGSFYGWVNLIGFLLQVFATSRIFRGLGVRAAIFLLPLLALSGYGLAAMIPVFGVVRLVKVLENAVNYSVQNTARHALFLPVNREAKYKAKAAIDTFFWRVGDVLQAGVVASAAYLQFSVRGIASVNIVLTLVWIAVTVVVAREHRRLDEAC